MTKKNKSLIILLFLISGFSTKLTAQVEPIMVFVKGGAFTMGSNSGDKNERPVHTVILSDFYIGKYEVTVGQYRKFCKATGRRFPRNPNDQWYEEHEDAKKWVWNNKHPIVNVSWNNAISYCKWLSKKTGKNYTLPTEAQWEYAAKGGNKGKGYKYSGSNNINKVAWYDETTHEKGPRPVGNLTPNELGIYDMSGNAWEWCLDKYGKYKSGIQRNPKGASKSLFVVIRGGSWYYVDEMCKTSTRDGPYPYYTNFNFGFRVVRIQ